MALSTILHVRNPRFHNFLKVNPMELHSGHTMCLHEHTLPLTLTAGRREEMDRQEPAAIRAAIL